MSRKVMLSLGILLLLQRATAEADKLVTAAGTTRALLQGLAPSKQKPQEEGRKALPSMTVDQCGKPGSKCGPYVLRNKISCPNGSGYCDPGFYCGLPAYNKSIPVEKQDFDAKCLPVPAGCGKAGSVCCPSNAINPHTKDSDLLDRMPFCTDGSICLFARGVDTPNDGNWLIGNTGLHPCLAVPKDCGTVGKPCCPNLSGLSSNPAFDKPICSGPKGVFCKWDTSKAGKAAPAYNRPGVCEVNPPDCGQLDKACCTEASATAWRLYCDDESKAKGLQLRCVDETAGGKDANPSYKCKIA